MKNYTLAVLKADKNDIQGSFAKAVAFLEKDKKNVLNAFLRHSFEKQNLKFFISLYYPFLILFVF